MSRSEDTKESWFCNWPHFSRWRVRCCTWMRKCRIWCSASLASKKFDRIKKQHVSSPYRREGKWQLRKFKLPSGEGERCSHDSENKPAEPCQSLELSYWLIVSTQIYARIGAFIPSPLEGQLYIYIILPPSWLRGFTFSRSPPLRYWCRISDI